MSLTLQFQTLKPGTLGLVDFFVDKKCHINLFEHCLECCGKKKGFAMFSAQNTSLTVVPSQPIGTDPTW